MASEGNIGCDKPGHPNDYSHDCAEWDHDQAERREHKGAFERAVPPPMETR